MSSLCCSDTNAMTNSGLSSSTQATRCPTKLDSRPFLFIPAFFPAFCAAVARCVQQIGARLRAYRVQLLLSAHVRSLIRDHLIDVVSTDGHTVKPWFGGHADVSPVVADFDDQGYRLIGGRADYLEHQRASVVISSVVRTSSTSSVGRRISAACRRTPFATGITWGSGGRGICCIAPSRIPLGMNCLDSLGCCKT
jgi:hypothetical protein